MAQDQDTARGLRRSMRLVPFRARPDGGRELGEGRRQGHRGLRGASRLAASLDPRLPALHSDWKQ